jgi:hypothetical protein
MSENAPTLDTFFQYSQAYDPGSGELKTLDSSRAVARMRKKVQKMAGRRSLPVTANELAGPIGQLLDFSLLDIMVRAWNENNLFEKYLDPDKYDPREPVFISLRKHKISSSHSPHVDVILNGQKLGQIDFSIDVSLTLEGIILELRGGQLREIRFGNMKGRGTLKCEGLVLLKRDTGTIKIPGTFRFSEHRLR